MHACMHCKTPSRAKSQDKRHALQAATKRCKVSYVLSFSSMFEPLRLSRASGSFSHLRASAGLQSSSTSVAVPTPPTILCLPCQSCSPLLTMLFNTTNQTEPHCNQTELLLDLKYNSRFCYCNSPPKCHSCARGDHASHHKLRMTWGW